MTYNSNYENSYERRGPAPGSVAMVVVAMMLGGVIGKAINSALDEDPASREETVQMQNQELTDELDGRYSIHNMILHSAKHTFTFDSRTADGISEICDGTYAEHDKLVQLIGDVTCQTVTDQPR